MLCTCVSGLHVGGCGNTYYKVYIGVISTTPSPFSWLLQSSRSCPSSASRSSARQRATFVNLELSLVSFPDYTVCSHCESENDTRFAQQDSKIYA